MYTTSRWATAIAAVAAVLLSGCSSPSPHARHSSATPAPVTASSTTAPVSGNAVSIDNFAFSPATLTVKVGSTVTWTNRDEEPHNVVANDGSFRSHGLDAQATYSHAFRTPGSYDYICSIHPFMHGTVVVTA
ncbi:MAG TPA: cupredoxin family copper-binding protein [Mycobacterium sp.]